MKKELIDTIRKVIADGNDSSPTINNLQDPILIVGMHNSGTSILAEILHKSGLFLEANMSHFESRFFSLFINDTMIMGGGSHWAKNPIMTVSEVMSFYDTIGLFIKRYWIVDYMQWGYDGVSPWGIKDPRLCVLLPLYLKIFPNATVVHIRRDPNDIAASLCEKPKEGIGTMNNFDFWKSLSLAHVNRVLEYSSHCKAYYELTYEDFCINSKKTVLSLFHFLGLHFTEDTQALLAKVMVSRIGSYQRFLQKGK